MKKLLTFLTLLTLFFTTAWAETATLTFADLNLSNGAALDSYTVKDITFTFAKANGSNSPAYYTGDKTGRTYKGNTITIAASDGYLIKSISITGSYTSNVGTFATNQWSGSSQSVVLTATASNRSAKSITVTYEAGTQSGLNDPGISFSSFTAGSTSVTATITPDDAATTTYYKIGENGTYSTLPSSGEVSVDLTTNASPVKVYAYSTDGTNTTDPVYQEFTLPALGVSISPSSYTGYTAQTVTITPSNYVGEYAITYTINGGSDTDYDGPFELSTPGTYEIVATVLDDRAGGSEVTSSTATITINQGTTYTLPFKETFNETQGTGGNSASEGGDQWGGSIATNTIVYDNDGWSVTDKWGGDACIRLGTNKTHGSITSPTITGLTVGKTYTLTFKAAPWGLNTNTTVMSVTASGATVNGLPETAMTPEQWNDFTLTLTATSTSTTLTFDSNANRFWLDEINVKEQVIADGYYLYGTFNGWNTKDANYKFTEDNGNYVLNDVDLPANVRFKISKVENGQVTEYGGSGDSDYGIHRDWHTHIDMKGVQAYTIAGAALTNFILHPDADINNMYFEVERVPQLYFKCDKINNWANNPMSQVNGVWTYSGELEAGAKFGFNDEWGDHHGYNWTVNPEHYGNAYDIPVATADTYTMRDAGNYKLDVNSDLTVLHVNKVFNINCSANPNGGGTVVAKVNDQTVTSAMSGETVTIEYTTNNGYTFSNISLNGNVLEAVDGVYSFVMTTQDAEVVANYTASSYNITVESVPDDFGTVTCPTTATTGQTVTFTVTPDEGYSVKSVTAHFVNGENNTPVNVSYNEDTEEYSFGMPPFPVTVTVTYKVPLQPCTIRFEETWNETNGMGGNDGNWYGIQQTDPIVNDNEGWIYMRNGEYVEGFNGYGANKCIRIGDGNNTGSATTPEIIVTNGTIYKMTFKAGSWDSNVEALLSATGAELYSDESCTTTPVSSIALPYRSWGAEGEQEHVVYVKATSSLMTITWSTTAAKKRYFLDEVVIDFFETPLPTELTLAEIIALGDEADGKLYKISDTDGLLGVYKNGASVWFKDEEQAVDYQNPTPTTGTYQYYTVVEKKLGINKIEKDFAQNNWIEVVFPSEQDFTNKYVKNLTGTYSCENGNPKLTLTVAVDEENDVITEVPSSGLAYELNPYMAVNFAGNQTYTNNGETQTFFFSQPKAQEYAQILWAVWNGTEFIMTTGEDNYYGFTGSFTINPELNAYSISGLKTNESYNFKAIIRKSASKAGPYEVYPTDLNPDVPTAINGVVVNGLVKSVKYVNVAGMVSDVPFQGVNIVVTEYTDGSRSTSKMLRK